MNKLKFALIALATFSVVACNRTSDPDTPEVVEPTKGIYILNEGTWGLNNASLSVLDLESDGVIEDLYSQVNGSKLGDVGNDIIITDKYIITAINGSNIIQFCDLDGKAVAQTEDVAGCRKLAADNEGKYLYVTSYANDGEVVKIDLSTFKTVGRAAVGYEPEGIVYYSGKLYVANTGGNAYLGEHGYEETISVVDAATMTETKKVKTSHLNLYGGFVQNDKFPRYIMVNASGDYYLNPAGSFVFDCDTDSIVAEYDYPATYVGTYDGKFYSIGSSFDYTTYGYTYSFKTTDMNSGSPVVTDGIVSSTVTDAIKQMSAPYGLYLDKEGCIYVTDAADYTNRGSLYRFSSTGTLLGKYVVGVCPGHFASR